MDIFILNKREVNGCKEVKIYDFYIQMKCLCEFFQPYLNVVTQKKSKGKKKLIQSYIIYSSSPYFLTKNKSCFLPFIFSFVKAIAVVSISSL